MMLQVLRDDLAQNYLFGEIFRTDRHSSLPLETARRRKSQQRAACQAGEKRLSIHPSPPSESSAIRAAGTAPARSCVLSTEAMPLKMNTPNPPPPIAAAIVAVPMVVTVAIRIPAIIVRSASGSSTSRRI